MSVPTSEIAFPQPLPPFLRPPSIGEVRRKAPQSLAGPFPLLAQDGQSVLSVRAGKEGQVLAKPWYMLEMKRLDEVSAPSPASAAEDERSERGAEESDKQKDPLFLGDPTKVPLFYFDGPFIRMACPKGLHANNLAVPDSEVRDTDEKTHDSDCDLLATSELALEVSYDARGDDDFVVLFHNHRADHQKFVLNHDGSISPLQKRTHFLGYEALAPCLPISAARRRTADAAGGAEQLKLVPDSSQGILRFRFPLTLDDYFNVFGFRVGQGLRDSPFADFRVVNEFFRRDVFLGGAWGTVAQHAAESSASGEGDDVLKAINPEWAEEEAFDYAGGRKCAERTLTVLRDGHPLSFAPLVTGLQDAVGSQPHFVVDGVVRLHGADQRLFFRFDGAFNHCCFRRAVLDAADAWAGSDGEQAVRLIFEGPYVRALDRPDQALTVCFNRVEKDASVHFEQCAYSEHQQWFLSGDDGTLRLGGESGYVLGFAVGKMPTYSHTAGLRLVPKGSEDAIRFSGVDEKGQSDAAYVKRVVTGGSAVAAGALASAEGDGARICLGRCASLAELQQELIARFYSGAALRAKADAHSESFLHSSPVRRGKYVNDMGYAERVQNLYVAGLSNNSVTVDYLVHSAEQGNLSSDLRNAEALANEAASNGRLDVLQKLVDLHTDHEGTGLCTLDLDAKAGPHGGSCLGGAARNGHRETAAYLLSVQVAPDGDLVDIDSVNAHGHTALQQAAFYSEAEVIELLLKNGADPLYRTPVRGGEPHSQNVAGARSVRDCVGLFVDDPGLGLAAPEQGGRAAMAPRQPACNPQDGGAGDDRGSPSGVPTTTGTVSTRHTQAVRAEQKCKALIQSYEERALKAGKRKADSAHSGEDPFQLGDEADLVHYAWVGDLEGAQKLIASNSAEAVSESDRGRKVAVCRLNLNYIGGRHSGTALNAAMRNGHTGIVRLLLDTVMGRVVELNDERVAVPADDIDLICPNVAHGHPALHQASFYGQAGAVEVFLAHMEANCSEPERLAVVNHRVAPGKAACCKTALEVVAACVQNPFDSAEAKGASHIREMLMGSGATL